MIYEFCYDDKETSISFVVFTGCDFFIRNKKIKKLNIIFNATQNIRK
jgi:hypothetical protein